MHFLLAIILCISVVYSVPESEKQISSLNEVSGGHALAQVAMKEDADEEGCTLEMHDGLAWLAQLEANRIEKDEKQEVTSAANLAVKRHFPLRNHPLRNHPSPRGHGNNAQAEQHQSGSFCQSRKEGGWYCDAQDTRYKIFCPTGRRVLLPEGRFCFREGRISNGQNYDGDTPINPRQFCQGKLSGRYCVSYERLGFHGMIECPTFRIGRCLKEKTCRQVSNRHAICVPCSSSSSSSDSSSSHSHSHSHSSSSDSSNCSPWSESSSCDQCQPYRINQVSVCLNASQLSLLPTTISKLQAIAFETALIETAITLEETSLVSSVWEQRNRVRTTMTLPVTTTSSNLFLYPEFATTTISVLYTPFCLSFVGNLGTNGVPLSSTCVVYSEPLKPLCLQSTTIYNNFSTCVALA